MKKRFLSLFLAAVLLLSLLPVGMAMAAGEDTYKPSQEMVDLMKSMEGFSEKPYWDNSQYSVGYGTKPKNDADLQRYMEEGISREEAEELLYYHLENKSVGILKLIEKYGLELTQSQFDALLSFSYNCGAGWTYESVYPESTLRTAVVEGWTGNDFLYAMGEWCTSVGNINKGLILRRMREANMYLNGVYSREVPETFTYVLYDGGVGLCDTRIQVYDSALPASIVAKTTYDGYVFDGWFTEPYGGEQVTELNGDTAEIWLYAHWSAGDGEDLPQDTAETIETEEADYNCEVLADSVNAFRKPLKGAAVVETLRKGRVVHIVAEFTDENGVLWGQTENGGWINLKAAGQTNKAPDTAVDIIVTDDGVNIRSGPGTNYTVLGMVNTGKKFTVTETATGSGYEWGKVETGWICLKYTNYHDVAGDIPEPEKPENPDEDTITLPRMGTVTGSRLRIRTGAGTNYAIAGYLDIGDRVEILEIQKSGAMSWGRTEKGWISLDYVKLDAPEEPELPEGPELPEEPEVTEPTVPEVTEPTAPEETTEPTVPEETTEPTEPEQPTEPAQPEAVTGKVKVQDRLRIRTGPGTTYAIAGYLKNGDAVTITEQKTVDGVTWGRTEKGWISMDYVELDAVEKTVTGTVKVSGMLRIRTGPGTNYAIAGYLKNGCTVTITEQKTVDGVTWGRTEKGWISLDFVTLDGEEAGEDMVKTVTATCLRIRREAGTENAIVGYLYQGAQVEVLETKLVGQTRWCRIAKGWVSGDYLE